MARPLEYKSDADLSAQWDYLTAREKTGEICATELAFKKGDLADEIKARNTLVDFALRVGLTTVNINIGNIKV